MNSFKLWPTLLALLIGGTLGFFIGKANCPKTATAKKDTTTAPSPPIAQKDTTKPEPISEPETTPPNDSSIASTDADTAVAPTDNNRNTDVPPTLPTLPIRNLCFTGDDQLSNDLSLFAEKTEKDSLWYDNKNPKRLQDCSGIFHRVVNHVRNRCDSYQYPEPDDARSSRSLAKWFHDNNNLTIINDAVKQRNLIKPGSVLFFGRSGQTYNNLTIDRMVEVAIQHIGVVTEVKKDDNGDVIGYVMFHGRRPGVTAQRSHYHSIKPPRLGYPPLGNWNQQLVGVAYIMTPI